jgi:ketosteroid isomerase-like protein
LLAFGSSVIEPEAAMSELDEFRSTVLARQAEAERAMVLGDPAPRMALWSRRDPVTLFGAATGGCKTGWDELSRIFRWVASTFSDVSDFRFDVEVANVSGDLAYTVGYERFNGSIDGRPVAPVTVRVTHVYRREDGEWKIVHRHGDSAPIDQSPPVRAATT